MNTTKKLITLFGISSFGFLLSQANAVSSGTISAVDGYSYQGTAGEFTLATSNPTLDISGYADATKNQAGILNSFQSFCLEYETEIGLNETLTVDVSTSAKPGGQSSGITGIDGIFDPISSGTAYLYTEFATGNLAGYNYTPGDDRENSALGLQLAIWVLEDEIDESFLNPYYRMLLEGQFTSIADAKDDNDQSIYAVQAVNITDTNGDDLQDQLHYYGGPSNIPNAPDAGSSLFLLGIALGGISFFHRRFIK